MVHFVAVGDVLVDVDVAEPAGAGERRHTRIWLRAGGSAVNAALAAADRGAAASVIGRVGADAAAGIVRDALAAAGVHARLAVDAEAPTGTAVAVGDSVAADPGASGRLAVADVPAELEADAVLVSGYTLLQDATAAAGRAALERARAPLVAVGAGSPGLAARHGLGGLLDLASGANVLFADEHEARALTGLDPEAAAVELARHVEVACVTWGARGAVAASGGDLHRAPAKPQGGGLGAGDALAGVLLVELARGADLESALRKASGQP